MKLVETYKLGLPLWMILVIVLLGIIPWLNITLFVIFIVLYFIFSLEENWDELDNRAIVLSLDGITNSSCYCLHTIHKINKHFCLLFLFCVIQKKIYKQIFVYLFNFKLIIIIWIWLTRAVIITIYVRIFQSSIWRSWWMWWHRTWPWHWWMWRSWWTRWFISLQ